MYREVILWPKSSHPEQHGLQEALRAIGFPLVEGCRDDGVELCFRAAILGNRASYKQNAHDHS
eukprot:213374-Amphidinium_carterae.1